MWVVFMGKHAVIQILKQLLKRLLKGGLKMKMYRTQRKLFGATFVTIGVFLLLLLLTPASIMADIQIMIDGAATPFGTFKGIDFVKYEGHLLSTTPGSNYDAPFEVVVPTDLRKGNGRMVVEPYHIAAAAGARDLWLTPDFLFGHRFMHAAICWQPNEDPAHPCADFSGEPDVDLQVIADFATALKQGKLATFVGQIEKLYNIGFSNSADPLHLLLLAPLGQNVFDLSFLLTTGWPHPIMEFTPLPEGQEPPIPPASAGRVIVFQSEADIILHNGAILRDMPSPAHYRVYEIAGAAHIPAPTFGTTGVDWLPFLRALFVAGDRWITKGVVPPHSRFLEQAPTDEVDPVYGFPTGIARDENLNAMGGIQPPDLVLGRGQFVAVDLEGFVLVGKLIDLQCEPLPDGSPRFPNHGRYVRQFIREIIKLIADDFLLIDDAVHMIQDAVRSDVGKPGSCP